ncbi:MAG: glycosyltransferase family 39 protein [Elusimicrobia bacterium]|nr:glycosyltransferase family 39 protein [Elusimicrobiota bacterium]
MPREMVELGDWITPRLDYMDYVEKPPLPYWVAASLYSAFGVSETTFHLSLAFWALVALAGTAWLGKWLFDLETGLAGAAMLGTCLEFQSLSHMATPDLPLTAMLIWTTAFWLRAMKRPEDSMWAGTLAGACMGLAMLSKGLVAIVFPVGWACACAVLLPELRPGFLRSLKSGLIPAFLIVAVPWFWVMEKRHPGFWRFFFGEQHFQRFLAGASKYRRYGPPWYFIPVLLVGLIPWTPVAGASLWTVATRWKTTELGVKALALWSLGVFGFFTVSSSKLPTYIFPLFPQLTLAAAAFLLPRGHDRAERRVHGLALGLGLLLILAVPVVPIALGRLEGAPLPGDVPWYGGAAIGVLALSTLALCLHDPVWRLAGAAGGAGLGAILALASVRSAEAWVSARPLAMAVAAEMKPGDRLISYGVYLHGLGFYTRSPVDPVNWMGELHYGHRNPANAKRFGNDNDIRALPHPEHTTFVALRKKEAAYLTSLNDPANIGGMRTFGAWALAKFTAGKRVPKKTPSSGDGRAPAR